MGRRDGKKQVEQVTEVIHQLVDPRNHRRKRGCAWLHSDRNRRRLPPPLPRTEAVHSGEHPQQRRPTTPYNKLGRSPQFWESAKYRGSQTLPQTISFLRVRGPKRAVAMT